MGAEAQRRERELQRELQDRDAELRGVVAEVGQAGVGCECSDGVPRPLKQE